MPSITSREVTGNTITTGIIQDAAGGVSGGQSTGVYGFREFQFLSCQDLVTLINQAKAYAGIVKIAGTGTLPSPYDSSRAYIRTHCHSRLTNTTGTAVVVDLFIFKALRMRPPVSYTTLATNPHYPASAPLTNEVPDGGGPLCTAAALWWATQGANGQSPPVLTDIDYKFTYAPMFKKFFKQLAHKTFALEHGQSIEFRWRLPNVKANNLDLYCMSNALWPGGSVDKLDVPHKTHYTVWRLRGAVGATAATDIDAVSTTAMATCNMTTTRVYHVKYSPTTMLAPIRYQNTAFPSSTTQVSTINQYGQGSVVQPATMAP